MTSWIYIQLNLNITKLYMQQKFDYIVNFIGVSVRVAQIVLCTPKTFPLSTILCTRIHEDITSHFEDKWLASILQMLEKYQQHSTMLKRLLQNGWYYWIQDANLATLPKDTVKQPRDVANHHVLIVGVMWLDVHKEKLPQNSVIVGLACLV